MNFIKNFLITLRDSLKNHLPISYAFTWQLLASLIAARSLRCLGLWPIWTELMTDSFQSHTQTISIRPHLHLQLHSINLTRNCELAREVG